jgi:hypothetical protein
MLEAPKLELLWLFHFTGDPAVVVEALRNNDHLHILVIKKNGFGSVLSPQVVNPSGKYDNFWRVANEVLRTNQTLTYLHVPGASESTAKNSRELSYLKNTAIPSALKRNTLDSVSEATLHSNSGAPQKALAALCLRRKMINYFTKEKEESENEEDRNFYHYVISEFAKNMAADNLVPWLDILCHVQEENNPDCNMYTDFRYHLLVQSIDRWFRVLEASNLKPKPAAFTIHTDPDDFFYEESRGNKFVAKVTGFNGEFYEVLLCNGATYTIGSLKELESKDNAAYCLLEGSALTFSFHHLQPFGTGYTNGAPGAVRLWFPSPEAYDQWDHERARAIVTEDYRDLRDFMVNWGVAYFEPKLRAKLIMLQQSANVQKDFKEDFCDELGNVVPFGCDAFFRNDEYMDDSD